jgi:hypothetical protein
MSTKKPHQEVKSVAGTETASLVVRQNPLVFVSHDTRDADLAEAFANLLTDASAGMLKSFRSSDRKGTAGIEFGQEWYKAIMSSIAKATDVVALLTHHSIDRPWILYEAGVAKGKLDATVLGVAMGIPLDKANTGPFAQFQNSGDDEDSLTKLVLQLIRRIPDACPREEAVRRQVEVFRDGMATLLKNRGKAPESSPKIDDGSIAKMFEEVKLLVRDLPERVQGQFPGQRRRRRFKVPPMMMMEEFGHNPMLREAGGPAFGLLVFLGLYRDDFPWLYELGLELYRALQRGDEKDIERAHRALRAASEVMSHEPFIFEMMGGPEDEEAFMFLRHFSHDLERIVKRSVRRKSAKEAPDDENPKPA